MLQKAIPVLPVTSIRDTIDFYERKLGFTGTSFGSYAVLKYKQVEIHLQLIDRKKTNPYTCCYLLVKNIEDLYAGLSGKELIHPEGQLTDKPWGIKEFSILDNNANLIRFGEKQ